MKVPSIPDIPNFDASLESLAVSLYANVPVCVIGLIIFDVVRRRYKILYSPRTHLRKETEIVLDPSENLWALIQRLRGFTDSQLLAIIGIDGLIFLRVLKLMLKIFALYSLFGIFILLPVYWYGGNDLDYFSRAGVNNIVSGSPKLWLPLMGTYFMTVLVCLLLMQEYEQFICIRDQHFTLAQRHQYSILILGIPDTLNSETSLRKHLNNLFPGEEVGITFIYDQERLAGLIKGHDSMIQRYNSAAMYYETTGKRPTMRPHGYLCGAAVDSLAFYHEQIDKNYRDLLFHARHRSFPAHAAFVTFRCLASASAASQVLWDSKPLQLRVQPAPQRQDLYWKNLGLTFQAKALRSAITNIIHVALVFFWMIPIALVSSLISLDVIGARVSQLTPWLDARPILNGFFTGYLPAILLKLFLNLIPVACYSMSRFEGHLSYSGIELSVVSKYFVFQIFNAFIGVTLGNALLTTLNLFIHSPEYIVDLFAISLPRQALFFVNYIILSTFTGLILDILRILPLWKILWRGITSKRPWNEICSEETIEVKDFGKDIPQQLLLFVIGVCYSTVTPIMLPFLLIYFAFGYVSWLYLLCHVHTPKAPSNGRLWPRVFNRMLLGLILFQLVMVGTLALQQAYTASSLVLPCIALTIGFGATCNSSYKKSTMAVGRDVVVDTDRVIPRTAVNDGYYERFPRLPPVGEVSHSDALCEKHQNILPAHAGFHWKTNEHRSRKGRACSTDLSEPLL